jgi:hypothetical protein
MINRKNSFLTSIFLFVTLFFIVHILFYNKVYAINNDFVNSNSNDSISYTLIKSDNPNSDEIEAYGIIMQIMDSAIRIYNLYTNLSKQITVYYVMDSSVRADGNINGNIRFGPSRYFMNTGTAIHEISHTLGIGTSNNWFSFGVYNDSLKYAIYSGVNATSTLRQITGDSIAVIYRDYQHFWPYGLNYAEEYTCKSDLINHCKIVNAMFKDGL